jgi:hypothetical protein
VTGKAGLIPHEILSFVSDEFALVETEPFPGTSAQGVFGASVWLTEFDRRSGNTIEVRHLSIVEAAFVDVHILPEAFDMMVDFLASE